MFQRVCFNFCMTLRVLLVEIHDFALIEPRFYVVKIQGCNTYLDGI